MIQLYRKLAVINMKSNRRFYLPYLLTGIISAAMFYLVMAMQDNPGLSSLGGGAQDIQMILTFGVVVVGVFVSIFLFYTNSFLMKRRKKELGIYNILGMEKKHLTKVLLLEQLFTAAVTITGGLVFGVTFHKLLEMILYRLTRLPANIPFYISRTGCVHTVQLFLFIYTATFLYNLMQIKLANPIELLHSRSAGEREPRTKLLLTLIGIITLGAGYYIAVTTTDAISALTWFFGAVLLVIAGTYCLFTAGSIAMLKLLRKNKRFYYQTGHFTTVSGMIYRMKQNAVGLANICILSTMVLVTVSTTVCMYLGLEDSLKATYPSEINIGAYYTALPEDKREVAAVTEEALKESGRVITGQRAYLNMGTTVVCHEDTWTPVGVGAGTNYDINDVAMLVAIPREDYEVLTGQEIAPLAKGEAAVAGTVPYKYDRVAVENIEYQVKQHCEFPEDETLGYLSMTQGLYYLIVPDDAALGELFSAIRKNWSNERVDLYIVYTMGYDIDGDANEQLAAEGRLREALLDWEQSGEKKSCGYQYVYLEGREENKQSFYTLYGGLFFLGMFLGSLFLMVTVLIIFYKQISEGYEDKERFAIMEKVGMSNTEVKAAIRSQVLLVFFLPLAAAILHVTMAFPMITMLLESLKLINQQLFMACVAGTSVIFTVIYLSVFLMTSRSYYKIVGNQV